MITRGMVELSPKYHPVPRIQPAARGHSQQFQRLRQSIGVDAYKYAFCPRQPSRSGMLSHGAGGRVTGGVQAASAVSPVITTCVHTARTVFLHLFLFEFTYALLPHCTFRHRCSLWLLCGATPLEDIATYYYWTRTATDRHTGKSQTDARVTPQNCTKLPVKYSWKKILKRLSCLFKSTENQLWFFYRASAYLRAILI